MTGLAALLVDKGEVDDALALLARIPESPESRHIAARARLRAAGISEEVVLAADSLEERLAPLFDRAKGDDGARQEILDLIEALEPDDPRRAQLRRELASRLF